MLEGGFEFVMRYVRSRHKVVVGLSYTGRASRLAKKPAKDEISVEAGSLLLSVNIPSFSAWGASPACVTCGWQQPEAQPPNRVSIIDTPRFSAVPAKYELGVAVAQ